jgi:para-nitrobenzyl esterase
MPRRAFLIFACLLLVGVAGYAKSDRADGTTVKIDSGPITGLTVGAANDVRAYKGIPFAAPPTGPLRWKAPQPVRPWATARACAEYGPSCPQPNLLFAARSAATSPIRSSSPARGTSRRPRVR